MNKIKRLIKKYFILFCTFFIINVFFIWITTNILTIEEQLKAKNSLISNNAKTMFFHGGINVYADDLLTLLKDKQFILESVITPSSYKDDIEVKGVYYNYPINRTYPLSQGRMFTYEELIEKEKVALVGYHLKDKIEDNIILVQGDNYKVVGILGDKKNNALNNNIFINLNSKEFNFNSRAITLDVFNENTPEIVNELHKNYKKNKNIDVYISDPQGISSPLQEAMNGKEIHLILAALASICLISTIINIGSYWIDKEKPVIGIKSLVGGTKISISTKFWLEYITTILLSLITSSLIWIMISSINGIKNMLTLKLFALLLITNFAVSTLAFIIPIINLMRLNINSIIKENI